MKSYTLWDISRVAESSNFGCFFALFCFVLSYEAPVECLKNSRIILEFRISSKFCSQSFLKGSTLHHCSSFNIIASLWMRSFNLDSKVSRSGRTWYQAFFSLYCLFNLLIFSITKLIYPIFIRLMSWKSLNYSRTNYIGLESWEKII